MSSPGDSQYTDGTAGTDASADDLTALSSALMALFRILGGVLVIVVSAVIIMLSSGAMYWVTTFLFTPFLLMTYAVLVGSSVSIMTTFGLTAVSLMGLFRMFPELADQIHDTLVQSAGLVLLVYPMMEILTLTALDGWPTFPLGIETPFWFVYPIIAVFFLLHPKLRKSGRAVRWSQTVLSVLVLLLGLLITVLTFDRIWAIMFVWAPYTALLVASPIVVIAAIIIHARSSGEHRTATTDT